MGPVLLEHQLREFQEVGIKGETEEWCEGRGLLRQGGFVKSDEVVGVKKKWKGAWLGNQH